MTFNREQMLVGRELKISYGTEGPKYDPYAYSVFTVVTEYDDGFIFEVNLRLGLATLIMVNGEIIRVDDPEVVFEILTGIKTSKFEDFYNRIHGPKYRCPKCGSKKFNWYRGFVGEQLQSCADCSEALWEQPVTLDMI